MTVTGITPARISPVATGTLHITGTDLEGTTSITIEGRACTDIVATSTTVTAKWPLRMSSGAYTWNNDTVSVVVSDGTDTATTNISYLMPVDLSALRAFESHLAAANTSNGYFFNWSPSQITGFHVDPNTWTTNGLWPQAVSYIETQRYMPEESTAGQRVYHCTACLDACKPIKDMKSVQAEAQAMISDLTRAICLDISADGFTYNVDVIEKSAVIMQGLAVGSLLAVSIVYEFEYNHIENDPTNQTTWNF